MNPIKTPRELLFELAHIPHMADGRRVVQAGGEVKKMIEDAIQKYIRLYKKPPPPEDIKALEAHAASLTQKPTIWSDPVTQARARHELATNPGLINPEDMRDPFITQAMVGRGVKGTRQAPFVADIADPNLQRSLEVKQMSGKLADLAGEQNIPSTTPAADALAKIATGLEQSALSAGKVPLIDKLKMEFFKKNKRYPNEEELERIVAEFNPLRHQYGQAGASIVQSRPPTAKGMSDWRSRARSEGVPEVYLKKPPADYPNYLQAELDIAKGVQPTVRQSSDDLIKNPNREYAEGRSVTALSPREMQADMVVNNVSPSKFEDPYERAIREAKKKHVPVAESRLDKIVRLSSLPFAVSAVDTAAQRLKEGAPGEAALHGASALGLGMAATKKYLKPGLAIAGAAMAPLDIEEAIKRYKQGDRTGAVLSAIMAASNASQVHPVTAVPGALIGMGTAFADALRDKPEPRSVMEDYK